MVAIFNSKTCFKKKVFLHFEPICADLASGFAKSGFSACKTPKNKIKDRTIYQKTVEKVARNSRTKSY
jgi:hypothetical protein